MKTSRTIAIGASIAALATGCGNVPEEAARHPSSAGKAGGSGGAGGGQAWTGAGGGGPFAPGDTPQPISPLSTSRVTSHRPTLSWWLPEGVADATVDLCFDRACTKPIGAPAHVASANHFTPSIDLPAGVAYWRVHSGATTTLTSPTWEFTVDARSTAVDSSSGTTLDVNGDGFADVVIGEIGTPNLVRVYLGTANGLSTSPASTLSGPPGTGASAFGASVTSAGDVNGDGYGDLAIGDPAASGNTGAVYVYLGGATGLANSPVTTLTPDPLSSQFGLAQSAGDVNGDGYADLLVVDKEGSPGPARAYVYLGAAAGLDRTPATVLEGSSIRLSVVSDVDMNGDGYADLLLGDRNAADFTGSVGIYHGSSTGLTLTPTIIPPPKPCAELRGPLVWILRRPAAASFRNRRLALV